ncbi:MAG: hypothetical protein K9J51_10740, partial [Desulfotignum sp.]|nr:hypothetical protein [Desulfotignum sp.]
TRRKGFFVFFVRFVAFKKIKSWYTIIYTGYFINLNTIFQRYPMKKSNRCETLACLAPVLKVRAG